MIRIIHCTQCDKEGLFELCIEYEFTIDCCKTCHHRRSEKWSYWFCNHACMFQWLRDNKIEEKGFHCRWCLDWSMDKPTSTGWAGGFESNGTCTLCNGTKRAKSDKDNSVERESVR